MTCPLCNHPHKTDINQALDQAQSYQTIAARLRLHLADLELHARHRRRAPQLTGPAFEKASRQAQLALIADHARHHLDLAFHDRRPAVIRAAARFFLECSAQLNRWIENNGDDTRNEAAIRERELDIDATVALLESREDLLPEWIRIREEIEQRAPR